MPNASARRSVIIGGRSFKKVDTVTGDETTIREPTVTAAKTGTLTARTDNDTGTIAAAAGHGVVSTNKVDVFWTGGARQGMTATVTGNDIAVDGGTGDNLPALNTAVTLKLPQDMGNLAIPGGDVVAYGIDSPVGGYVVFKTAADAVIKIERIPEGGGQVMWDSASGVTNPLTGQTVGKISFSHDDETGSHVMTAALLH